MTELAHYQPPTNGTAPQSESSGVIALRDWAESAQAAHAVAESLVQTSFVPEAFRGKAHEATAAILSGAEIGLSPMAALRSFDIIQGTAAPRAMTLRAVLQSRGHEIWVKESTDTRAIVQGRRAGSDIIQESTWDTARARGLNLLGKHNWKAQPKAMLVARATAECCRMVAADAILGIPYAVEELDDGTPDDTGTAPKNGRKRATAVRPATRATQKAAAIEPAPGPPLPGEEGYDEPGDPEHAAGAQGADESGEDSLFDSGPSAPAPAGDTVTPAQLQKLHVQLGEIGIEARDAKLSTLGLLVGRELESSKDVTRAEATQAIDRLGRCLQSDDPANALMVLLQEIEEAGE